MFATNTTMGIFTNSTISLRSKCYFLIGLSMAINSPTESGFPFGPQVILSVNAGDSTLRRAIRIILYHAAMRSQVVSRRFS